MPSAPVPLAWSETPAPVLPVTRGPLALLVTLVSAPSVTLIPLATLEPVSLVTLALLAPPATSPLAVAHARHVDRMIEVLRRSPVLRLGGGRTVSLAKVRRPARTLSLSAEAVIEGEGGRSARETTEQAAGQNVGQTAAIVFGPENGAVSETLVFEAAREAYAKSYVHLYVAGFASSPTPAA